MEPTTVAHWDDDPTNWATWPVHVRVFWLIAPWQLQYTQGLAQKYLYPKHWSRPQAWPFPWESCPHCSKPKKKTHFPLLIRKDITPDLNHQTTSVSGLWGCTLLAVKPNHLFLTSLQCFWLLRQKFSQRGLALSHLSGHWAHPIQAARLFPKPRPDPGAEIPSMFRFRAQVSTGLRQNHFILQFPVLSTILVCKVMAGKWQPQASSTAGYHLPATEAHAQLSELEVAELQHRTQKPRLWGPLTAMAPALLLSVSAGPTSPAPEMAKSVTY